MRLAILKRDLQGCQGIAADANTLYLPTEATTGANEIVAIDLATGKEKWRVEVPGRRVHAAAAGSRARTHRLRRAVVRRRRPGRVDPRHRYQPHPDDASEEPGGTADVENGFFSKAYDWADGRFYLSTTRLSGRDDRRRS